MNLYLHLPVRKRLGIHDENISYEECEVRIGKEMATRVSKKLVLN
jgi:hypothetical protein